MDPIVIVIAVTVALVLIVTVVGAFVARRPGRGEILEPPRSMSAPRPRRTGSVPMNVRSTS